MPVPSESSNLIQLIKSLKQGEKRYITLELSRYKKENNLLKLYHVINNSISITDADIKKKIRDKKFISQLSINKHKLYTAIRSTLQQLHSKSSPYFQGLSLIHQSYLLHSKGLWKAKEELLAKAAIPAKQYELRELQLQIVNLHQQSQHQDSIQLVKDIQSISEVLLDERKLNRLYNSCLTFELEPGGRLNILQKSGLRKIMDEALKIKCDSFTASYFRLRICFSYYAIIGDHLPSYTFAQKLIALFRKFPHMLHLETWRIEYIESLRNFIPAYVFMGKTEQREFIYKETKRLDVPDLYKASITINIMDSYIQTGEYAENEKHITDIQKHIDYYRSYLSSYNRPILYFNLALLNFGIQKFSKGLHWLNEIINNSDGDKINISLATMTRIMRLVFFYELDYTDVFENYLRSTLRFIAKQKVQYRMDEVILKCLRKITGASDKKLIHAVLQQTATELLALSKDRSESRALDYFDFISWINSKLQQQSFAEVAKQKNLLRLKKLKPGTTTN